MVRAEPGAAQSVERFFQLSLTGLVAAGYFAVAGSGYLDNPTIVLTAIGLLARILMVCGAFRIEISERATTTATVAYAAFFAADYFLLSRDFLSATVHLLFFLAVMKILTARTNRDYAYTAVIAFLELLAAALLSVNFNFFAFLALYLVFAVAALSSGEIRRSAARARQTARGGGRRFGARLALLSVTACIGILAMTSGLFFLLPRGEAVVARFMAHRLRLPGFASQVTLGDIAELKTSSRPVMHVRIYSALPVGPQKWRGGVLTGFDGKRWTAPPARPERIDLPNSHAELVSSDTRGAGIHVNYHIDLEPIESDALFFAGAPESLDLQARAVFRTEGGVYRLGRASSQGLRYDAYSLLDAPPERTPPPVPTPILPLAERDRALELPPLDPRIAMLAGDFAAGQATDLERARAIERRLRSSYGYTLETPAKEPADPLADFLFHRHKGHCEYFASALAVMLRTQGIPARLATGFEAGVYNPISDLWLIRAGDAHSWVEAWIAGRGWVTFDPTPADPSAGHTSLLTRLNLYLDAAETFWQEWVVAYDLMRQGSLAGRLEQGAHRMGIRWYDAVTGIRGLWNHWIVPLARRYGVALLGLAACGLLLGLGLRPLIVRLHWRTRVARVRRGQASVADATLLYRRMLRTLERRGYRKPPWFTPGEFADSLPEGPVGRAVGEFTAAYNAVRVGGRSQASTRMSILLEEVERAPRGC